ncbi:hypothetical protein Tco_0330013, partial [Tanacetum coccineum]
DLVSSSNIIAQSLLVATQADVIHVGFQNRLRYFIKTDTLNWASRIRRIIDEKPNGKQITIPTDNTTDPPTTVVT